ncbi:MAG: LuxR C-terminal-related transcriptional regulator, partial [Gemmatimonadota bacterium]
VRDVTSYLMGEVLERQSPAVRDHLLRSSVAARFCAPLCDALAGAEGPDAKDAEPMDGAEFVEWVEQAGLFVIPLDAEHGWLRYHHLFQDLLVEEAKRRLGAEAIATLHSRASEWFEAEGLVTESIEMALAGGDEDRAGDIVVRSRREALNADHWYLLEKWLALLTDAVVRERAELLLARVWILVHHSQFAGVPEMLGHIESLLGETAEGESLRGEVFLMRGYMLFFLGQGAASVNQVEQALDRIPVSFYEARAQSEVIFALSSQMEGLKETAIRGLDQLLHSYQLPSDLRKTRLLVTHVFIHMIAGDLAEAQQSNRPLRVVAETGQYAYATAWADYLQGLIHLHRCELAEAAEYLKRSVAKRFIHFKRAAVDSIAALMLVYRVTGRSDQAETTRRLLGDFTESLGDPSLSILAGACEARLSLLDGRLEPAIQWMKSKMLPGAEAPIWWLEVPGVTRCRALIAEESTESLCEAEQKLTELAELCEAHHNTCQLIPVLALKALALDKQGRAAEALRVLEEAVRLARPGGFIFPFVEPGPDMRRLLRRLRPEGEEQVFVQRILAAFEEVGAATPAGDSADEPALAPDSLPEPGTTAADLTSRELDVLELLGERLQDKEIAARLYVTKHTVNHHLKRIYRKLGVSGRRQAVKRATELGILPGRPPA